MPSSKNTTPTPSPSSGPPPPMKSSTSSSDFVSVFPGQNTSISQQITRLAGLIGLAQKLAHAQCEASLAKLLADWQTDLEELKAKLATIDGLAALKGRLSTGWPEMPTRFPRSSRRSLKKLTPFQ